MMLMTIMVLMTIMMVVMVAIMINDNVEWSGINLHRILRPIHIIHHNRDDDDGKHDVDNEVAEA